ncbi:RING-type E3 ubiquitin transferase [Malassezia nana]|uniref:RING-type E3 ubiquitin transferase n=1 Tax=Malassezia nana TaxID=180528 RepID=A0AAF0EM33_9BASI|nr:RING-type E3 ubiquitin transferase [Malassezia nana]
MNFPSKQAENTFAKFEKVDSFQADPADELYGDEKTVVDVPFGIVHLFRNLREATSEDKHSTSSAESTMPDEDIGTILAMINVSSSMSASRLLSFVGPALATMQHVRLIHQTQRGLHLMLMKFYEAVDAEEFFKMFHGRLFDTLDPSQKQGLHLMLRSAHCAKVKHIWHLYCLEVDTQRVWDYAGDGYVHRLIQSKTGGKLVELPSASDAAALTPERLWNARYPGALDRGSNSVAHSHADERSPTRESENEADDMDLLRQKMEALGTEYSNMIVSQLDSQRVFYESQMKTLRANSVTAEEHQAICKERETLESMQVRLQEEIRSLHNELDAVRSTSSKQATQLKRALEALTKAKKDLADEKSVSDGLYAHVQQLQSNQNKLQGEVADLQEQLRDVMFFVSARQKIEQGDDALGMAGGDVVVPDKSDGSKGRSRRKR